MESPFYLACDLGTTTVDCALIDRKNKCLGERHFKNRQALYGADVITRMAAVNKNSRLAEQLADTVLEDLSEAAKSMTEEAFGKTQGVLSGLCICGNTTMISILSGLDCKGMGTYPFVPPFRSSLLCPAEDFFQGHAGAECFLPAAQVLLSGCASAFIGGDVLAGLLALSETEDFFAKENALLIDLGTNGEMVLKRGKNLFSTSCACGPAFEGCVRRQGLYGSTLLDVIALGIRAGKIGTDGILAAEHPGEGMLLSGILITGDILEQILLAKAAVLAGIRLLLIEAGIRGADLSLVALAGGFGLHLSEETALMLGLFPASFSGKVKIVGNTSLAGARLLLLRKDLRDRLNAYTDPQQTGMLLIQPALRRDYQELLFSSMSFRPWNEI